MFYGRNERKMSFKRRRGRSDQSDGDPSKHPTFILKNKRICNFIRPKKSMGIIT